MRKSNFNVLYFVEKKRMAPFGPFIKAHALVFFHFIQFVRREAF